MRSYTAKALVIFASRALTRGAQLISFLIIARVLTAAEFGEFGVLTTSVFLMGVIGNVGLRQSAAHAIGRNEEVAGKVVATILAVWPVLAAGCCSVLWFSHGKQGAQTLAHTAPLFVSMAAVLGISLLQGVMLGRGDTNGFSISDTGPRLLHTLFFMVLWITGTLSLVTALVAFSAGFVLLLPATFLKSCRGLRLAAPDFKLAGRLLGYGFLFSFSLFLISFQSRIGLFYLRAVDGAGSAGQFFAAQRISEILLDIATAAALIVFSDTVRTKIPAKAIIAAARIAFGMFVSFSIVGLVIALAAPVVVNLALGGKYNAAGDALIVLALGLGPMAAARVMNSAVSGVGKPIVSAAIAIIGLMVNLLICSLTTSTLGPAGAALGLVVGQLITCLGYVIVCIVKFNMRFSDVVTSGAIEKAKAVFRRFT